MSVHNYIEDLIIANIKIWHEATKIKDTNGKLRQDTDISIDDRVKCAFKIREMNAERSQIRWGIDKHFECGANETKIFNTEEA